MRAPSRRDDAPSWATVSETDRRSPDERERRENEPYHRVTIARAVAMGKTEVTWDQWEAGVRDRWCDRPAIDMALRMNEDGTLD